VAHPIVAIDTSVIIWLARPEPDHAKTEEHSPWLGVRETIKRLEEEHAELIVPAPVIAELGSAGPKAYHICKRLLRQLSRLRIEAFDRRAAEIAGEMAFYLLSTKGAKPKQAVKFDTTIAAVAVSSGASSSSLLATAISSVLSKRCQPTLK